MTITLRAFLLYIAAALAIGLLLFGFESGDVPL